MHELTFIANLSLSENDQSSLIKKIKEFIESREGHIVRDFSARKLRLAYPIQKQTGGILCSVDFELRKDKIGELTQEVKTNKNILRHIIVNKKLVKPKPVVLEPTKIQPKTKQTKIKIEELDKKLEEILQA
ncbi:MAG: 30S ribosomal protein S6 [Candidatus Portnoybacteria bacterium]|nr:30S ribosomal protein S6 [Candidatus Portnoybacteria bacterium]